MAGPSDKKKESKVEEAKKASRHLRGTIAETLASDTTHFEHDDINLLKFHGTYQQDDRDNRRERREAGQEPDYSFMVRVAIPGGVLNAEQYLELDEIAGAHANGTLRITTRQGLQFHGVYKPHLKSTIATSTTRLVEANRRAELAVMERSPSWLRTKAGERSAIKC